MHVERMILGKQDIVTMTVPVGEVGPVLHPGENGQRATTVIQEEGAQDRTYRLNMTETVGPPLPEEKDRPPARTVYIFERI